jgi:hypothetical protein
MANSRQACLALLLQYHGAGEVQILLFAFFHVVCEPMTLVFLQFPGCARIPPSAIARGKTIRIWSCAGRWSYKDWKGVCFSVV